MNKWMLISTVAAAIGAATLAGHVCAGPAESTGTGISWDRTVTPVHAGAPAISWEKSFAAAPWAVFSWAASVLNSFIMSEGMGYLEVEALMS